MHQSVQETVEQGRHFLHEPQCIIDGRIHLVQGPMCRCRMTATGDRNEQGFVEKRDGHRAAEGMLEKIVECGLIGQNETDVLTETCERSVKSAREAAG